MALRYREARGNNPSLNILVKGGNDVRQPDRGDNVAQRDVGKRTAVYTGGRRVMAPLNILVQGGNTYDVD